MKTNLVILAGASGDIGRILEANLRTRRTEIVHLSRIELERFDQHEEILDFAARVQSQQPGKNYFVANCTGMNRITDVTENGLRRLLDANVRTAESLLDLARCLDCKSLHLSSGDLDLHDWNESEDALFRMLLKSRDSKELGLSDDVYSSIGNVPLVQLDHYAISKRLLEKICSENPKATCVRVSNFFGVKTRRMGFIPRLIEARLHGSQLVMADERRNWAHEDELASFLTSICLSEVPQNRGTLWAYGSYDKTSSEVFNEITLHLPTCYGAIEFSSNSAKPFPKVPRIHDQLNTAPRSDAIFKKDIRGLVRKLRQSTVFLPSSCYLEETLVSEARARGTAGGSIASKVRTQDGSIIKRASQLGYEGAGVAKINAEINFYKSLAEVENEGLRALYAKLISYEVGASHSAIELEYVGRGLSASDVWSQSGTLLEKETLKIFVELFEHSYLRSLRVINWDEGANLLNTLYFDRSIDRLMNLSTLARQFELDRGFAAFLGRLENGSELVINGKTIPNPLQLLTQMREDKKCQKMLRPKVVGRCGHGDLTVLNLIYNEPAERLVLIDPRGEVGEWDPAYDVGKLMFSLAGFAEVMVGKIQTKISEYGCIELKEPDSDLRSLRDRVLEVSRTHPAFSKLLETEAKSWRARCLLSEATHFLADAAYRLLQGLDINRAASVLAYGSLCLQCVDELVRAKFDESV